MNELALIEKKLSTHEGIELPSISAIQITDNKLIVYKDFHVLLYIRDQYVRRRNKLFEYKFHICNCKTIEEMTRANRFARYVVSTRNDGMFLINTYDIETDKRIETGKIVRMNVCKNCLMELKYKGYGEHYKDREIYQSFDIAEFFRKYASQFKQRPQYTDKDAPPHQYSDNFEQISYAFRDINAWQCSECHIDLRNDKELLDTHHVNGIRSDNSWGNLQCLCIRCHAEKPYHERLKNDERYARFIMKYGQSR